MKKIMKKALSLVLVLTMMLAPMTAFAAEGDSFNEPVALESRETTVTVAAGEKVYFTDAYNQMAGDATVVEMVVSGAAGYEVGVNAKYDYSTDAMAPTKYVADDEGIVICNNSAYVMGRGGAFYFTIENKTSSDQEYYIYISNAVGTMETPDELTVLDMGENWVKTFGDYNGYFYTFTAPADGIWCVEMDPEADWIYAIMDEEYNYLTETEFLLYSDDEPCYYYTEVEVEEGETYILNVNTYNPDDYSNMNPEGYVGFFTLFVADDLVATPEGYEWETHASVELWAAEEMLIMDGRYTSTIFDFSGVSDGTYTITMDEDDGYFVPWGYSTWPVAAATASSVSFDLEEGQQYLVEVVLNENAWDPMYNIDVEYKEFSAEPEKIVTSYENECAPISPFTYVATENTELQYVDTEDITVDKAVYSVSDGYYHLNTKDGAILYVNLKDSLLSLANAADLGQLKVQYEDKEANKIYVTDYREAVLEYVELADAKTGLVPLTVDLMTVLQEVGAYKGWYGATGFVGGEEADAWMFCCYYEKAVEKEPEKEPEKQPETEETVKVEVPTDKVVTESVLGTAIQEAVKNDTPLVVETTTEGVTLTFAPADLKDAEAVKLNVEVKLDADVKDETVAKNDDITADNFVLKVEFSHDGKLPAKATITIPVPAKFANKTLFYYEILADGTLKFVCDAPVDANGNAKVTQDHCSDYVLLTEKVAEAPKTGDNTNFALWIAVLGLGVVAIASSVVMKKREF